MKGTVSTPYKVTMEIILFLFGGNSFIEKVFFVETSLKQQETLYQCLFSVNHQIS